MILGSLNKQTGLFKVQASIYILCFGEFRVRTRLYSQAFIQALYLSDHKRYATAMNLPKDVFITCTLSQIQDQTFFETNYDRVQMCIKCIVASLGGSVGCASDW